MKQNYLKSMLVMLMMCLGMSAWAEEETYNFASFTSGQDVELNATNFTITLHKRTGGTNPQWSSNQARVYAKGSLEISSQKTITKIVYSYVINANSKGKEPSIDGVAGSTNAGSWNSETKTWTGNDTDVTLSTSGDAGNVGFTSVTVTYENAAGKENTTLSWSAATATVTIDADDNVFPTLTTTPVGLTGVTYSSSNAEAATINATTGAITLVGAGATTITASYAGDATHYAAADVSYDLTVKAAPVVDGYTHDALTNADFAATGTTYADFSNVSKNLAFYAGNSSKNNGIQLRSSNSNSGIVSVTSGGKIKKIVVTWNSACASGRTLDVYGKNSEYTAASDLYNTQKQGTKLGSIVNGTSTELTVTGSYDYVGVRSNSGALNIDEIEFVWDETPTFASLDELIAADLAEETVVNVTLEDVVYGGMSNNGLYMVQLQNSGVVLAAPSSDLGWAMGGTVNGTLEKVTWDPYNYALTSESDFWSSLEYTAPAGGETETITINPACTDGDFFYTTYSSMNAFYAPQDLIIYEVMADKGEIALESYDPGELVPAYTGLLVCAMEGGDYKVTIETDEAKANAAVSVLGDDNALRPTCIPGGVIAEDMEDLDPGCKFYRLTMHKGETIGFWWGAADGAAFALAENKAYLAMPSAGVKAQGLWFNMETAIKNVVNQKAEDTMIFNLQGQRVNAAQKGIYIMNGRKVVK